MDDSNQTDNNQQIIKNYKSIKTKSYVNKNWNDPNILDFKSMSHDELITEATRLQRFLHSFLIKN
jgi:hypothetical protein